MEEIRVGTIGSGPIVHAVLDGVKVMEGIRCAAVYSRTKETARKLAAEYGVSKTYTDMEKFLSDKEINVVYIATPNLLHYEQTKGALLAGKHVICEKPFCTRGDQAEELINLAKKKKLFLVEAAPTTFLPNFSVLKEAVSAIGRIRLVQGSYCQYSSRYDNLLQGEVPNIFNPELAGGCLMDINFYNAYLNVALFGKPEQVVYYPNFYKDTKIDTSGLLVMQYEDFVSENVGAKDTWGVNSFQIQGEEGYVYVEGGSNSFQSVRIVTRQSDETLNLQENVDRRIYEVRELTRLFLADAYDEIYKRLEITLDTVCVIESARKAAGLIFPGDA